MLLMNKHPANFLFVIVTKICPSNSINEVRHYFMTISRNACWV